MLNYEELLTEIKHRSPSEKLALLEELVHSLRQDLIDQAAVKYSQRQTTVKPEDLGWPPGYFEQTFGSLRDDPIERGPQGNYEIREPIQ